MKPLAELATDWPALSALLDEALALPSEQRGAWLDALHTRPGLSEAMHSSLRQLLSLGTGVETDDFMATLPRGAAPGLPAEGPRAGQPIGPYRLIRELGRGGMGAVWLAERSDGQLKRQVALKLPHLTWAGNLAQRMVRERDILARLEHPHIARLYDAGIADDGLPFLALEFVEGQPIDTYCDERGLDLRARLVLFDQVLRAVQYAHANLVIHRDLKPSNILVTPGGEVRLLDFGIAKLLDDDRRAAETALTQVAGRALTLAYASPEQVRGEPLGTASDVYALGVVLYALLSGERPYRLQVESAAQLEQAILSDEPPRASGVVTAEAAVRRGTTVRRLARALAGDLDTILAKALAKAPAERYDTAAALAQDLERHLSGQPIAARPAGSWLRLAKLVRRNRLASVATVAVVMALAIGLTVALWQAGVAREQARLAQQAVGRHEGVRQLYSELFTAVAGWDAAQFSQPRSIANLLDVKLVELEAQYKDRPSDWAGILNAALVIFNFMGEAEDALKTSRRYLEVLEGTRADLRSIVHAHLSVARNLGLLGRFGESETMLRQALDRVPESTNPERATLRVSVLSDLGQILSRLGRRADAKRALEEGRRLSVQANLHNRDYALLLQNLGNMEKGFDNAAALSLLEASNRIYLSNRETEGAELSLNRMYLGGAQMELGRLDEAVQSLRASLDASVQDYGFADTQTVAVAGDLAWALVRAGRQADAGAVLARVLAGLPDDAESRHRAMRAALLGQQAQAALAVGDLPAAEAALRLGGDRPAHDAQVLNTHVLPLAQVELLLWQQRVRQASDALASYRSARGDKVRLIERFLMALAEVQVQRAQGDPARAAGSASELLRAMDEAGVRASWLLVTVHEWAALTAAEAGQAERARALLQALGALQERVAAPSLVEQADSRLRQARAWARLGDADRSRSLAQGALSQLQQQHPDSPRLAEARTLAAR